MCCIYTVVPGSRIRLLLLQYMYVCVCVCCLQYTGYQQTFVLTLAVYCGHP